MPRRILDEVDEIEGYVEGALVQFQDRARTVAETDARPVAVVPLDGETGGRLARIAQRQFTTRVEFVEFGGFLALHALHPIGGGRARNGVAASGTGTGPERRSAADEAGTRDRGAARPRAGRAATSPSGWRRRVQPRAAAKAVPEDASP